MEINITDLFNMGQAHLYSASKAELGESAGQITWNNALKAADEYNFLDTGEKRSAFREFVAQTGGWSRNEIFKWTRSELNALLIQFVAGDIREAGLDTPFPDWGQYQEDCEAGLVSGRIFRADDNQVYYYIGN